MESRGWPIGIIVCIHEDHGLICQNHWSVHQNEIWFPWQQWLSWTTEKQRKTQIVHGTNTNFPLFSLSYFSVNNKARDNIHISLQRFFNVDSTYIHHDTEKYRYIIKIGLLFELVLCFFHMGKISENWDMFKVILPNLRSRSNFVSVLHLKRVMCTVDI